MMQQRTVQEVIEQHQRDIWNAAIEAAAKVVDQANRDGPYNAIVAARDIRALAKP